MFRTIKCHKVYLGGIIQYIYSRAKLAVDSAWIGDQAYTLASKGIESAITQYFYSCLYLRYRGLSDSKAEHK